MPMTPVTSKEESAARAIVLLAMEARAAADGYMAPDPDDMNERRATWGQVAITAFRRTCRGDDGDALADLLNGLIHLADQRDQEVGWSFEAALQRARLQYREETTEEETIDA